MFSATHDTAVAMAVMIRGESLDKVPRHDSHVTEEPLAGTCPSDDKVFEIVTRLARRCVSSCSLGAARIRQECCEQVERT